MSEIAPNAAELQAIYRNRFEPTREYRAKIWQVLVSSFFNNYLKPNDTVLDLGCGYGEFINTVVCAKKFAMDLNSDTRQFLRADVTFLQQDCSERWELPDSSLDLVFTSNFFEHLPSKDALAQTLVQARRCLRPGGKLIAIGPNIHYLGGSYWDFWDHHLALSHLSLAEVLELRGFGLRRVVPRFLPYTLVNAPRYPIAFLRLYLRLPLVWRLFGGQFLLIAEKS